MLSKNVINEVIKEWSWRVSTGMPDITKPEDLKLLREVLIDDFELSLYDANKILKTVAKEKTVIHKLNEKKSTASAGNKQFKDEKDFEKHILKKFAYGGQAVGNLNAVYFNIFSQYPKNDQDAILKFFKKGGGNKVKAGSTSLKAVSKSVYELCRSAQVVNGHFSELWFAIHYNGLVKGGVAGATGIISDVELSDGSGVSLKDYAKIGNVNFGKLPNATNQVFQSMLSLFQLLSNKSVNVSQTRAAMNKLLDVMDDKKLQKDIEAIVTLSKNTTIPLIKRIGDQIVSTLGGRPVNDLIDIFVETVDQLIDEKVLEVKWWGIIEKGGTVHMETATGVAAALKSENRRLSDAIGSFESLNLRVNAKKIMQAIK